MIKQQEKSENNYKEFHLKKNLKNSLISMKIKDSDNDNEYLYSNFSKLEKNSKTKLKWKIFKCLIENRRENDDKINLFYINNRLKGALNKKEFEDFLVINTITIDKDMINKIFWVFDPKGLGSIDYLEIAFGLEMFSESSPEEKLKGNP